MELLVLMLVKILDNIISTAKSIATYKGKVFLSGILVIISQFMFYFVVKSITEDGSLFSIAAISISSGIGTLIAMQADSKFKKDITYTNILTCSENDSINELCESLRQHNIKYILLDSYSRNGKPEKTVLAFAGNKKESKMIDMFLDRSKTKYLRQILH